MRRRTVDIITLGCSKNLVDSEKLMRQLELSGYRVTHDSERPEGEVAVINTCGFIGDAKEESVNMILEMAERKKLGRLEKLFVMGCLSERYLKDLEAELPEVDAFYGKFDWERVVSDLGGVYRPERRDERHVTTPAHYAYLKISEGCSRRCAYCAIPLITGEHRSRPMEEIVAEVRALAAKGVREFQVIAQELTYYGLDLYKRRAIAELVGRICDVPGVEWVRLHYAYPAQFPDDLLQVMAERPNVCKYLDIALQHISDSVLRAMSRHITREETMRLIGRIRAAVPGIHLRTTLMVGFPGETDEDFRQLLEFVQWARFERMGAFAYSEEEGTPSARDLTDNVPADTKRRRLDRLMRAQQAISAQVQEEKVGRTFRTVIDRVEGDYYVGRTEFDSPEVDPEVLLPRSVSGPLLIGSFHDVTMDRADDFDLYGHINHTTSKP